MSHASSVPRCRRRLAGLADVACPTAQTSSPWGSRPRTPPGSASRQETFTSSCLNFAGALRLLDYRGEGPASTEPRSRVRIGELVPGPSSIDGGLVGGESKHLVRQHRQRYAPCGFCVPNVVLMVVATLRSARCGIRPTGTGGIQCHRCANSGGTSGCDDCMSAQNEYS